MPLYRHTVPCHSVQLLQQRRRERDRADRRRRRQQRLRDNFLRTVLLQLRVRRIARDAERAAELAAEREAAALKQAQARAAAKRRKQEQATAAKAEAERAAGGQPALGTGVGSAQQREVRNRASPPVNDLCSRSVCASV